MTGKKKTEENKAGGTEGVERGVSELAGERQKNINEMYLDMQRIQDIGFKQADDELVISLYNRLLDELKVRNY